MELVQLKLIFSISELPKTGSRSRDESVLNIGENFNGSILCARISHGHFSLDCRANLQADAIRLITRT